MRGYWICISDGIPSYFGARERANMEVMVAAISPIRNIGISVMKISGHSSLTGYAWMRRSLGFPCRRISPKFSCNRHNRIPITSPAIPPMKVTAILSHQKIFPIFLRVMPRARNVDMEPCYSSTSIEREEIILKDAIRRMKKRIRKVIHFSMEIIRKLVSCC